MLSAPARLFPSAFNTADADMPPHAPARHTHVRGMMCDSGKNRARLARHSVAARQDLRGTRLHSRFYCNRKPPLSASGRHRFMKHPAPIFKTKAPPRPPPHRLSRLRALISNITHPPFFPHPPPSALRKLTFLNKWAPRQTNFTLGDGSFCKVSLQICPVPKCKVIYKITTSPCVPMRSCSEHKCTQVLIISRPLNFVKNNLKVIFRLY